MIVLANKSEITEILSLTRACAREMITRNIFQWNENYPTAGAFYTDIERGELYVLKNKRSIIGSIVISTYMDNEYQEVDWLTPSLENIYIHRLAVHPTYQSEGNARRLMDFALVQALDRNATSIRLDTFSQNTRNQKFYEGLGFKKLGSIYFPKQSEHPFYCYEKVL